MELAADKRRQPFSGYFHCDAFVEDAELTHTGRGTPCGELMRKYWQPICLSQELTDLPRLIRVLGEDLVVFRDRSNRIGLVHRSCPHRGTSLEFGKPSERGIRCCYHGWLIDIDGSILETPNESPTSRLKETVVHGAYPALEERGIVFAYLGPPDLKPPFPVIETYGTAVEDCVPFSVRQPCNWLQCHENNMDPMHAPFLHASVSGVQLTPAFGVIPVVNYVETEGGAGMHYISVRRTKADRVWIRFQYVLAPNYTDIPSPMEEGIKVKYGQRTAWNRWTVPNDDVNCTMFGWRYLRPGLDAGRADRSKIGRGALDAAAYQDEDHRSYEEKQREPGDWVAQVAQGPIAIHAREHLGASDTGVAMWRRLVRRAVRGEGLGAVPPGLDGRSPDIWSLASDTVLAIPRRSADGETGFLRNVGKQVFDCVAAAGKYNGPYTEEPLKAKLRSLEAKLQG